MSSDGAVRAIVVGAGSIGVRHERLLRELGCKTAMVSRRGHGFEYLFSDLSVALDKWKPDYVVVANATVDHFGTLVTLAASGYSGSVLIEKPIFDRIRTLPSNSFSLVVVAYNLRFHPLIRRLKSLLVGEKVLTAQIYVGQYLPQWRSGTDYRKSYSASRQAGGGVLRDLSHEIDYALWLFGPWHAVTARGGHFSSLDIDSEDSMSIVAEMERCPLLTIHMNYLDRKPRRYIHINTESNTIHVDMIAGTFEVDGQCLESYVLGRDDTYRAQHIAMLTGTVAELCNLGQGLEVVAMIEAVECANADRTWRTR